MKTLVAFTLAFAAIVPTQAQIFRSSLDSAVAGAVVGGVIGNNSGSHNGGRGAVIGAGVGLLLDSASRDRGYVSVGYSSGGRYRGGSWGGYHGGYGYGRGRSYGGWNASYGYSRGWNRPYSYYPRYGYGYRPSSYYYAGYSAPVYGGWGYYPSYDYDYDVRPYGNYSNTGYRGAGLVLGGLAGGIIGHNSGRGNGWQGALIGAGAGYLLGSVADNEARRQVVAERAASSYYDSPSVATGQSAAAPQNVTIINNYYNSSTPMSGANGLFGR